jgi:hypothetical protein
MRRSSAAWLHAGPSLVQTRGLMRTLLVRPADPEFRRCQEILIYINVLCAKKPDGMVLAEAPMKFAAAHASP